MRTHPAEAGGVVGGGEFQTVPVGTKDDVVAVSVLVDHDSGVVSGDGHVTQEGEGRAVVGRRDQPLGAMGRLGGLHVVDAGVDENILESALQGVGESTPPMAGLS